MPQTTIKMGSPISRPTPTLLPKPSSNFLAELESRGVKYADSSVDERGCMYVVELPDGWSLRRDETSYGDHCRMTLFDETGTSVASLNGKYTSYDAYCRINKNYGDKVDLSRCIVKNGWLINKESRYVDALNEYRRLCQYHDGYPDKQKELDEMWKELEATATELGKEPPLRIKLGDSPLAGAAKSLSNPCQ